MSDKKKLRGKPIETIGVLIVHGIGEQRRFEHLESEARKIIDAILAKYASRRSDVTVSLTTGASDAFHGEQSGWLSGAVAPLRTFVELDNKVVEISFHEIWWADVNERLSLGKQIRFWLWGLSIAGMAPYKEKVLPNAKDMTLPTNAGTLTWWRRSRLAYVSMMFGLSAFSIALINVVLKRVNLGPLLSTNTIVNYLSGVKLYSQHVRAGGSPLDGPDEPPRAAIRRRMVRAIFDAAAAGYDRWYILAHSLGSVVAWNAIMEPEETLPNYLDQARLDLATRIPGLTGMSDNRITINPMLPSRPIWLGEREIVSRKSLFRNFRGILTYGCPLERFGALWPATVPVNPKPFSNDAEWINVYDPTDPVATRILNFSQDSGGTTGLSVMNFSCRSSPLLLLSHIRYLSNSRPWPLRIARDTDDLLVNRVAEWLVNGGNVGFKLKNAQRDGTSFLMPIMEGTHFSGRVKMRLIWAYVQWFIFFILFTGLALPVVHSFIYRTVLSGKQPASLSQLGKETVLLWLALAFVVVISSVIRYLIDLRELRHLMSRNKQTD